MTELTKEQEFEAARSYSEMMREEEAKIEAAVRPILDAIRIVKGEGFFQDLCSIIEDCEIRGIFEIVDSPEGNKQSENYKHIKRIWVAQVQVGDSGDCFGGCIEVELSKGRYLQMPF